MESSVNPKARSVLAGIKDAVVGIIDLSVNASGSRNALARLFYDSELGSSVEKSAQKAAAVSVYKALVKLFPSLKADGRTTVAVSRAVLFLMDRSKLLYLYKHGRISEARYYDELTKRYTSILVAAVRVGEDMLQATLPLLLEESFGIDRTLSTAALQMVFSKIDLSDAQKEKLVSEGLRIVARLVGKADAWASRVLAPVRTFIADRIVAPAKKMDQKVRDKVKALLNQ